MSAPEPDPELFADTVVLWAVIAVIVTLVLWGASITPFWLSALIGAVAAPLFWLGRTIGRRIGAAIRDGASGRR